MVTSLTCWQSASATRIVGMDAREALDVRVHTRRDVIMETSNLTLSARRYDRRQIIRGLGIGMAGLTLAGGANLIQKDVVAGQTPEDAQPLNVPFDFENGNAIFEVFALYVPPVMFATVSPFAMDATLILRITTLIANGWYDAIAPYHPTAVGVYSRLGHRPANEATNANRNIAILYASFHLLNSLMPRNHADWRAMLESVGLDPDDGSEDPTTAVGIGNLAGRSVVAVREHDGMNQLGDGNCSDLGGSEHLPARDQGVESAQPPSGEQ
jgi:hypothetical protein